MQRILAVGGQVVVHCPEADKVLAASAFGKSQGVQGEDVARIDISVKILFICEFSFVTTPHEDASVQRKEKKKNNRERLVSHLPWELRSRWVDTWSSSRGFGSRPPCHRCGLRR